MRLMKFFPLIFAVILVASLVSVWLVPSIQDFMAGNTMWNGVSDFLQSSGAHNIDSSEYSHESPENSALIVIPYTTYNEEEISSLKSFLHNGGTVLLIDDFGFGNTILEKLGFDARFSGKALLDPLFCYKNYWLPRITDFNNDYIDMDIEQIVLNHATALINIDESEVIAWSSPASFLDIDESGDWNSGEPKGPLPVAAELPFTGGSLILVSDPSLVINSMVSKNDNFYFIEVLINHGMDDKEVSFDISHLSKTPLDISKSWSTEVRNVLQKPYPSLAVLLIAFVAVSRFMLFTGGR